MPDIVLSTLNARFIHPSFGLRYLLANLGPLRAQATLVEFEINQRPLEIVEALLAQSPKVIGLGVYIWNVTPATEVVAMLKRLRPDLVVILGGPEVSHEADEQAIVRLADYVIQGEADLAFPEVCGQLLAGGRPLTKILSTPPPALDQLVLPYDLYTDEDIAHRLIYVEASRGCPFSCEFCLSGLDVPVRSFPLPSFLEALRGLLERGARQLKFVDRTFNLNLAHSQAVFEFLLEHYRPGQFFHFEMVPDRLPPALRELIRKFPAGALQFEVGVQTFNPEVAARISRRQDLTELEGNFRFLREQTQVHLHADLVLGLPGESLESIAAGFDRLIALQPQEIQVGILKKLRGAPIARHDQEWGMVYSPHPPYEILRSNSLDFPTLQRLRRFARYWDLVGNSGHFVEATPLLWTLPQSATSEPSSAPSASSCGSPFVEFLRWSDWLFAQVRRTDSIALNRLMELLFRYLTTESRRDPAQVAAALWRDYQRSGHREKPSFLTPYLPAQPELPRRHQVDTARRQARHLARNSEPPNLP